MHGQIVHNLLKVWFSNSPKVFRYLHIVVFIIIVPLTSQIIDHHQRVVIISVAVNNQSLRRMLPQSVKNHQVFHRQLAQYLYRVGHQLLGVLLSDLLLVSTFIDFEAQVFCQVYQLSLGDLFQYIHKIDRIRCAARWLQGLVIIFVVIIVCETPAVSR